MPTWLQILITVLVTLMIGVRITIIFYFKLKKNKVIARPILYFSIKKILRKLNNALRLTTTINKLPKINAIPEKVGETLGILQMDISDVEKYKTHKIVEMEAKYPSPLCYKYRKEIIQISITTLSSYDIYYNHFTVKICTKSLHN